MAQCSAPANAIVAENCLTGNPSSEWDLNTPDGGDPTIQGFATDISVNQGGTVTFKINTTALAYTLSIYRVGYYGGLGARKVANLSVSLPQAQSQPACMTDASVGLVDCGNWAVSATWQVPATAVSGVYFAHLVRTDTGGDSHVVFVVRNDTSHSAILYQTSDETWQAYNYYGGGSLYGPASPNFNLSARSYKVSYNRPFLTRGFAQESDTWLFGPEFPMIQWLEQNGYDVTYSTGVDATRSGTLIQNHKLYMDSGHDEYWAGTQRTNVQAARDAGVNLAFFSGNTMFWKTRWENSIDGTNTPNRTLVCYKETLAFAKIDPSDPPTWTGTYRDPSFSPPADGGIPENAVTGTLFVVNGTGADNDGSLTMKIPAAEGAMRFWRNTAAATLGTNATLTLPPGSIGYEWDTDADNGFRPAGLFDLSSSSYTLTSDLLLDYGATYGAGNAVHHMTFYRAPSGALVFSAGTINWSWGLNSNHQNPFNFTTPAPSATMQQATVNLFADMGVQPTTLQAGIVAATASTDVTPPTSSITSPAAGAALNAGSTVTVTGTAHDVGGVVAAVEFSSDNGTTWHPATGRATWTYTWTPSVVGSTTLLSRAVDDSGNLEAQHNGQLVTVSPQVCPCGGFNASAAPVNADSGDGTAVEVGMKFRADSNGSVLGVRFYKAAANTGQHVGHIWSSSGTQLGTANFVGESASGWQAVNFSAPIPVVANTTYVVSYFAPAGHYSADQYAFQQTGIDDPPVHILANGVDGPDGVFTYGTTGGFPSSGNLATNYWVDVIYTSSNTYNMSGTVSGYGGVGATLTLSGPESSAAVADANGAFTFSGLVNGTYSVTPSNPGVTFTPAAQTVVINGGVVTGVNFTAVVTNPLSIAGTISGGGGVTVNLTGSTTATTTTNASGNYSFTGLLGGTFTVTPILTGYSFTPGSQTVTLSGSSASAVNFAGVLCNCSSIWQPSAVPGLIDANDATPVELGVKFRADSAGLITGVRFYKAGANTGTHIGHLWTSAGVQLGSATFTNESASGWQSVTFASPISVQANTTYIASYFTPTGHYSADTNYFATAGVDSPPLHALANGVDGANGVYLYTSSGAFPTNTYASTNYWVDVVYVPAQAYPLTGTVAGGAGATVALMSTAGATVATTVADGSGNYSFTAYSGTYSVIPSLSGTVFTPGNQNVTVGSAALTGVNFSVPTICPCTTIWPGSVQPGTIDSADTQPYELGVKITADSDGYILGIRFYKSAANAGAHLGNLWSTTGTLLASASFTSESGSGWQQVFFGSPVAVTAGTTYVASYFTPVGRYSSDSAFFASAGVDTPPLHALSNGAGAGDGVFLNAATSGFPTSSYNATNYWVDAIYAKPSTHSIGGTITGAVVSGVSVALSGASSATAVTNASGSYSFSGLVDGNYTVKASGAGLAFTPATQAVTVSGSHQLGVNFVDTAVTASYVVSGVVTGGAGVTVALTGAATASTTTNASGAYSFPSVANGSYVITPSSTLYTIAPASESIIVNGANLTAAAFKATLITYSISGTITSGSGATVKLSGAATATMTASSTGAYSFAGLANGSYTVTPTKSGTTYLPASTAITLNNANATANFAPAFTISGTISGAGGSGATVALSGAATATTTASSTGAYSFPGHVNGSYTVTPSKTGYTFTPVATTVTVNGANATANFTSAVKTYTITGTISGAGGSGASVKLTGAATATVTATSAGVYTFTGVANGSYTVTPTKAGFTFTPASTAIVVNGANGTANFTAVAQTFTLSGTISGAGGSGATVKLSGASTATVVASASGAYSFTGLAAGAYTVTPTKSGHIILPSSQSTTIKTANVALNFLSF
ncbi:DUF4082 domain-containing protein [Granulicella arctica]|uniref:DUF4082 domain-containing protein n=1 Tax=Granulicella arctica TaxID=940613 RepID=UPI0021E03C40|nr:DUF4082 domain-containing protein [Granulicella arctica]